MKTARILFRPICSGCQQQVYGVIDYNYTNGCVNPFRCQNCGAVFVNIEMPYWLPFHNEGDQHVLSCCSDSEQEVIKE